MTNVEHELPPGIYLWDTGAEGLAKGVSPDFLAAAHPLWEHDVRSLSPYERVSGPELDGNPQTLWKAALKPQGGSVLVTGPAASSLDVAWCLLEAGWLKPWDTVLTVSQTQGRGQMRRAWDSPPGNLYAAWVWPELCEPWAGLSSLLAGLAACQGLEDRVSGMEVKWPNDLLSDDVKVGGILTEERQAAGRRRIVAGMGLNLASSPPPAEMRAASAVKAGYLNTVCSGFGPLKLWLEMSSAGRKVVEEAIAANDPRQMLAQVEARLAWRWLRVRVLAPDGQEAEGMLTGLADDGGLRLERDGEEQVLYSGSILPLY